MKCIRCGQEMVNILGGNYQCPACGQTINDLVYRGATLTMPLRPKSAQIATHCVICGKEVVLDMTAPTIVDQIKVCDDCKKAIAWAKENMQNNYMGADATQILLERLCHLEDKIENGTLIELPCKVGDTVYKLEKYLWCDLRTTWEIEEEIFELGMLDYLWGKTIFLTKTEAEAKLRELEENG